MLTKILFFTYQKPFIRKRMENMKASFREIEEILNKES